MTSPPPTIVAALYRHVRAAPDATHFAAWRGHWERIHGAPGRKRPIDIPRLAAQHGLEADLDLPALLYAVESCFVLRMRALAHAALAAPLAPGEVAALSPADAHRLAARLLSAAHFAALGVRGYRAELFDFTALPLTAQDAALLRDELCAALAPAPPDDDALRGAYHRLLPKQARHALGAYYTPPWLADYVVETVRGWLPPNAHPRMIDPACGAGTFLVAALRALVANAQARGVRGAELLHLALGAVVGLDINPVAVHAAQTNLLRFFAALAAREHTPLPAGFEPPAYLADGLTGTCVSVGPLPAHTPPALDAPFDAVIGNPPWVNWEYIPPEERARTQHLWAELGLFAPGARYGAWRKEDVAGLFTYAAARRFLGHGGLLGFVLPQSLLKSSLNGRAFRRFRLGDAGPPLEVLRVDDMVALRPFEGASGRPAALFLRTGRPTAPPVPYRRWSLAERAAVPEDWSWPEVRARAVVEDRHAAPSDPADPSSPWSDAAPAAAALLPRLSGACAYRARAGMFTGGANGVFYVELIEELPGGLLRVRNLTEGARRGVPAIEALIEPAFAYPLLRGREVGVWSYEGRSLVICPHTAESRMAAVPPDELLAQAPLTFAYLAQFRAALEQRRGFAGWERRFQEEAFYACQRIGAYTFAPYKLVWRYIAPEFRCAVVGPGRVGANAGRPVIPHEKLMLIPFEDEGEAHFVCGLLSSSPARLFVHSRMVETQIAPHVIARLALPRYDPADARHAAIAGSCRAGHALRRAGDEPGARAALAAIDALVPGVLPVSAADVAAAAMIS